MSMTDEELVLLSQKGDEKAENEILEKYKETVVKISRGYFIIGGELEDIVQEGMIGLYKAIKSYKHNKNATFKTYAITCIKNQIQTAIKKASTKKNLPLTNSVSLQSFSENDDEDFLPINLIFQVSPDEKIINQENYYTLVASIKKTLSKNEFDVLKLYLQGYSYKEIAEKLKLNQKSIDNSLSRIKSKIKTLI